MNEAECSLQLGCTPQLNGLESALENSKLSADIYNLNNRPAAYQLGTKDSPGLCATKKLTRVAMISAPNALDANGKETLGPLAQEWELEAITVNDNAGAEAKEDVNDKSKIQKNRLYPARVSFVILPNGLMQAFELNSPVKPDVITDHIYRMQNFINSNLEKTAEQIVAEVVAAAAAPQQQAARQQLN